MPDRYRRVLGYCELTDQCTLAFTPFSHSGPDSYLSREVLECGHTLATPSWNGRLKYAAHRECGKCLAGKPRDLSEGQLKLVVAGVKLVSQNWEG